MTNPPSDTGTIEFLENLTSMDILWVIIALAFITFFIKEFGRKK